MSIKNFLSIDVEDYFQVSAFEKVSPPETWHSRTGRVEQNTELILSLLAEHKVKATFFMLGWVAEHYPQLVHKIARLGHEVASHGYGHQRVYNLDRQAFRKDIRRAKQLLEDAAGTSIWGYRAPSYSISHNTEWAFDELLEAGYRYDSSIFPIKHDLYGIPDWPRFFGFAVKGDDGHWEAAAHDTGGRPCLREVPITTLSLFDRNLPIAGGGYFRLLPYAVTRWGLKRINQQEQRPFVFYLHPWEFDPLQPRMEDIPLKSRFRHYLNLHKTESRFKKLISDFSFTSIHEGLFPS